LRALEGKGVLQKARENKTTKKKEPPLRAHQDLKKETAMRITSSGPLKERLGQRRILLKGERKEEKKKTEDLTKGIQKHHVQHKK